MGGNILDSIATNPKPLLLKQVRVIDPIANLDQVQDIFIDRQKHPHLAAAKAIAARPDNDQPDIYENTGLVLGNGFVDLYSTSGEPGFEQRETLKSLAIAAQSGGFSQVCILPHTQPPLDNLAALEFLHHHNNRQNNMPFSAWGAITHGCLGQQMVDLAELSDRVVGFTDAKPISDLGLIKNLLAYLQPLEKTVMLWAWDQNIAGDGVMREGQWSMRYGLSGSPATAETTALAATIEQARAFKVRVHLMRISTARGVELINRAKNDGVNITASVSWLQLCFCDRDLGSYDPNLHLDPPLGTEEDRLSLIAGLKTGVIDAIAVDHTPYGYEEKELSFEAAPAGAIGLELVLPILWQKLVVQEQLSALELWQALSSKPAQCINQPIPKPVNLFAPNQNWLVEPRELKSLSHNTPYLGQSIKGKVLQLN
ncbi:dihydroorotase [Thalassoporum mexicanum]